LDQLALGETVRVIFYRQNKQDGTVAEAYWLQIFPSKKSIPKHCFAWQESLGD